LQHGTPQQIIECGETRELFSPNRQLTPPDIDSDTFQEYLMSLSELYNPNAYHLIDFNCNNFTADVVGFLTGAEIPSWISGESPMNTAVADSRPSRRVSHHAPGSGSQAAD
jgi:hypothetical protein